MPGSPDVTDFERPFYGLKAFPTGAFGAPHELALLASIWYPFGLNFPWVSAADIDGLCFGNRSVADWVARWSQGKVNVVPPRQPARVFGPYLSWHAGPFYFRPKGPSAQAAAEFRNLMQTAGLGPDELAALTPFDFPVTGTRYHDTNQNGDEVLVDDRHRSGTSTPAWHEAVEHAANEVDLTAFAGGGSRFDPRGFFVLMVRAAERLNGCSRELHMRNRPKNEPFYVYPPGEYRRDGQQGKGVRLPRIAELSYNMTGRTTEQHLAVALEELMHNLGLADAYEDSGRTDRAPLREADDLRQPGQLALSDAGWRPVGLDPYIRLKLGWGEPRLATHSGTFRLRPAETSGDMLILATEWRGQDEFFIVENRTAPAGGYDATRDNTADGTPYGNGLAIWHIIEDADIGGQYARRAVSLLRPRDNLTDSPLWDPDVPFRSYRLDDVSAPQHLRMLGTRFDKDRPGGHDDDRPVSSGLAVTGMRWDGDAIDVDVRVPVAGERVVLRGEVAILRVHELGAGWGVPGSADYLSEPAIVVIDSVPALRLGVAAHEPWGTAMLEQLLDSHVAGREVTVVYRTTGPCTGEVFRLE